MLSRQGKGRDTTRAVPSLATVQYSVIWTIKEIAVKYIVLLFINFVNLHFKVEEGNWMSEHLTERYTNCSNV